MDRPLLLHSLREYRAILVRCFEAVDARRFVEIGSESGAVTRELVELALGRGGSVTTVEPAPAPEVVELARTEPAFRLVVGHSPAALDDVEPADAWVVDGDHNHWTVTRELEAILAKAHAAGRAALTILHDVGWPCARRDFYYDPSALPEEAVRPHTFAKAVRPGEAGVVPSGLRGEGKLAVAEQEGGPANGVLTAVHDVLAARDDLELITLAPIYGVGFVFPTEAPWAAALRDVLAPYAGLELLERMEDNRVALYLQVIELQDRLHRLDAGRNRVLAARDARVAQLEAEIAGLRVELARARVAA